MNPSFSRSEILYGEAAQDKFRRARVAVCGTGAVGTFAVEALARMGIGGFRLIDSDTVDVSNINRQLCALHSTIGRKKTDVVRARVLDINPDADVKTFDFFICAETLESVFGEKPDVIVDAIDSLEPKALLIKEAVSRGVPIVSSMGAARKKDPLRIKVGDIFETRVCPVAARMRRELRAFGMSKGCMCVYSEEAVSEESHLKSGAENTKKIIGSTPVVTGAFGLVLANLAVEEILSRGQRGENS